MNELLTNGPRGLQFLRDTRALAPFLQSLPPEPVAPAVDAAPTLAQFYRAQFKGYIPHAHNMLRQRAAVFYRLGESERARMYTAAAWELCDTLKKELDGRNSGA